MHYGIIESINQGNFPPEVPYYSGLQMNYHYFVDFHTAVIEKVMEGFYPRLLVVVTPVFMFLFALSLYLLSFYITNNKFGVSTWLNLPQHIVVSKCRIRPPAMDH